MLFPLSVWVPSLWCWAAGVSSSSRCHPPSGEDERLTLKLINRPMLILRGENGFICHHRNSNTLDASRSIYDIFSLQFSNGSYHIKGQVVRSHYRLTQSLLHLWLPVLKQICASSHNDTHHTKDTEAVCLTLCLWPSTSRRCGRPVLVCEQCWAGVLRWRGARGLLSGAAWTRTACHPYPQREIPAWRPGRHAEGGRTQPEQLSPVGVLKHPVFSLTPSSVAVVWERGIGRWQTPGHQQRVEASYNYMTSLLMQWRKLSASLSHKTEGGTRNLANRGLDGVDFELLLHCKTPNSV